MVEGRGSLNFSLLICGSIARVCIAYFCGKKIDGFVTQYASTVGLFVVRCQQK